MSHIKHIAKNECIMVWLREGLRAVARKAASAIRIAKLGFSVAAADYCLKPPENRDWLTPMAANKGIPQP